MHATASFSDALERLRNFAARAGKDYARLRNYDLGPGNHQAVSQLSPYLARRVILPEEVLQAVLAVNNQADSAKFCQEVYWQTYWRGWLAMRPQVWEDAQKFPQPTGADYTQAIEGKTGIDAFDFWVHELKTLGYLHNHARMWFASIWIHTLKLPWKWGASFFYDYLCDADCATNTLGWRWVAGLQTPGKAYMARLDNIIKYTKGRFAPRALSLKPTIPTDTVSTSMTKKLTQLSTACPSADGWIIFPDDFSVHRTIDLTRYPVLALAPKMAYPWRSETIHRFNEALLQDLKKQIPNLTIVDTLGEVTVWAKEKHVSRLGSIKSPIGVYDKLQQRTKKVLPRHVALCIIWRAWDQEHLPKATKGFFNFKKAIGIP